MANTTHSHWHKVIDDLMALAMAGGSGYALSQAIKNEKMKGNHLGLALTCGGCLASLYFAADKIHDHYLDHHSSPPSIQCPDCGHDGNHHYHGIK